jgi:hypothetical protein
MTNFCINKQEKKLTPFSILGPWLTLKIIVFIIIMVKIFIFGDF